MANANDARVVALRKSVDEKRAALKGRSNKFVPVTNASLELDGVRTNLHTLDANRAYLLAAQLQSLITAANELWFSSDNLIIGEYKATEWLSDVRAKVEALAVVNEEAQLRKLDAKLKELLSQEAKTDIAIDEIAALLS